MNSRLARISGTRLHDYHEPALVVFALLPRVRGMHNGYTSTQAKQDAVDASVST